MLRSPSYFENRFHNKQEQAWIGYKAGKHLTLDWGRRSGKTELVADILVEDVETYGHDCMYVAISQVQARKILWPKLLRKIQGQAGWKPYETTLEACYKDGPVISLKGADKEKDSLRGDAHRIIACLLYTSPSPRD
jgi:hypothetical protein